MLFYPDGFTDADFLFRNTKVPKNAPPQIYSHFVDAHLQDRLEQMKLEILQSKRPVRSYPCKWTGTGFEQLEEFGKMVLEDLWSGVLRDERYVPKYVWEKVLDSDPDQDLLYNDDENPVPVELPSDLYDVPRETVFADGQLRNSVLFKTEGYFPA